MSLFIEGTSEHQWWCELHEERNNKYKDRFCRRQASFFLGANPEDDFDDPDNLLLSRVVVYIRVKFNKRYVSLSSPVRLSFPGFSFSEFTILLSSNDFVQPTKINTPNFQEQPFPSSNQRTITLRWNRSRRSM
jgi:hypothetical protein